jgi:lipid-A-disaccharide synthase
MGFVEIARHWRLIRSMFADCRKVLLDRRPAALVLIDYPGFNMRFARDARRAGIPVVYYISPQVWAWGKHRLRKLSGLVDKLACVFPFEEPLFRGAGIDATFVGHPLLEILETVERKDFLSAHGLPDKPILGLFPGSRKQEINRMLPVMLEAARMVRKETGCQPVIGAASQPDEVFNALMRSSDDIILLRSATHGLMQHSHAALVTSGTATVETALYETPMVIAYRASFLNYQIGRRIVNVQHIGMPNILAGRTIAPELIQNDCTAERMRDAILPFFTDPEARQNMIDDLAKVRSLLGDHGASGRVAELVLEVMKSI